MGNREKQNHISCTILGRNNLNPALFREGVERFFTRVRNIFLKHFWGENRNAVPLHAKSLSFPPRIFLPLKSGATSRNFQIARKPGGARERNWLRPGKAPKMSTLIANNVFATVKGLCSRSLVYFWANEPRVEANSSIVANRTIQVGGRFSMSSSREVMTPSISLFSQINPMMATSLL